jgi:LPS export ABC transporter permease LptG/LPS export ABC transporter permease LptF
VSPALPRSTLLDRYVVSEVVPPTGLGLLLFTFILLLDQITNLMKVLVSRGADLPTVVRAFLYLLPSIFAVTIPMAFLLGVLLAFGRLASDSEIVALRASGVSPARLLRPVLALSLVATLLTFYVFAVLGPAANQAYREILFSLIVSRARTEMKPRVFTDDLVPGMVLYVSDIPAHSGEWRNLFVHDNRASGKPRVILARAGQLVIDKARKSVGLELRQGIMHSFDPADPGGGYVWESFQAGYFPLPFEELFPTIPLAKGDREMSMGELRVRSSALKQAGKKRIDWGPYDVEYHKKVAIPAACVVFGLLGLGLSLGSKKEARSAAFGLSIGVIFVYYVIIRLGEQAGDTGLMPPFVAMWGANAILGAIAVALLVLNHRAAAFDPLDASHYLALLPRLRRDHRAPAERPLAPGVRPRGVVVLRIPRWSVHVPSLLDRYIARTWTGHFLMVLVAFWAIFVLVNFMDLFDDIQRNRIKGVLVFHYYAFSSPSILHLMAPVAVLVAVLITFGVMSRRNEITAMKAAGISVYRASAPMLALGVIICVLMFGLSELVLPSMNKVAFQDRNVIKGRPPQSSSMVERRWILGSDRRLYNYDYLEQGPRPGGITLYGLSIFDVDPATWDLRDRLYAARASWNGVSYDLERGWYRSFGSSPRFHTFQQTRMREIEPPSYFNQEERESDTLGFKELRRHIASLQKLGLDVTSLKVQLHRKLSFPLVTVVMTLIGIPFAFVVARRGALYGIAAAIVIAIVYWGCLAIFEALGSTALLPPLLASWTPNILFGAVGLYLMLTLET